MNKTRFGKIRIVLLALFSTPLFPPPPKKKLPEILEKPQIIALAFQYTYTHTNQYYNKQKKMYIYIASSNLKYSRESITLALFRNMPIGGWWSC